MATSKIPNPMERRHLLEKRMDAKQALALAESYLALGRSVDALAFLDKAEAKEQLGEMAEEAVAAGDAFLLKAVLDAQGLEHAPRDDWNRLADAAEEAGKGLYATLSRRMANPLQKD